MCPYDITLLVKIFSKCLNFISSISPIWMAALATFALFTWKREFIGKKKINLAEEVFIKFREVVDVINVARYDVVLSGEITEILNNWKLEDDKYIRYIAPGYRINKNIEKIESWFSLKNQAYVYWGEDIDKLFNQLDGIVRQIQFWSSEMYRISRDSNLRNELNDQIEKGKKIILESSILKNDEIKKNTEQILLEVENNLKKLFKEKKENWVKLEK